MIVVEIVLVVLAWRKGWGWLALIPLVGAMVAGFVLGYLRVDFPYFVLDVLAVVLLGVMVAKPSLKGQLLKSKA